MSKRRNSGGAVGNSGMSMFFFYMRMQQKYAGSGENGSFEIVLIFSPEMKTL